LSGGIVNEKEGQMDFVTISGVVSCHSCPVRYYLEKNRDIQPERIEYTISKQISYHLGRELCDDEIWEEIKLINPQVDEDCNSLFLEWLDVCRRYSWPAASEHDVLIRSLKLGVTGRIDCLYRDDDAIGIVRTTETPETGIYKSDRIRAAMASICAEETLGFLPREVRLLYIPGGTMKTCKPSPADRRGAIRALAAAKRIDHGYIPEKKENDRCKFCYLKDYCISGPEKLSDII